jgi:hypothetical protein
MNPAYDPTTAEGQVYFSQFYSISPDGMHVALWLNINNSNENTLGILEVRSGEVTDYCIPSGESEYFLRSAVPIWSKDGKSFIVAVNFQSKDEGNDVILVNIEKNEAYKVMNDAYLLGWLARPK